MIYTKPKTRVRRYSCYYCDCTGFFTKNQVIFQIWNWGYQIKNKKICYYCDGRGFIEFKRKFTKDTNFQSLLEHWSLMTNIPKCPTCSILKDNKGYLKNVKNLLMKMRTNIGQGRSFFLYISFLIAALTDICSIKGGIWLIFQNIET